MSRSGSEAIAKALKGGGLSSVEKIKKAREAWNNNSLFFPNKDDFLFTWLCSSFAKPNMKKLDDCCLFQIDYWILFVDLLEHYQQSQDRNLPPVHINPLASVIVVLQHIDNITKDYLSLISRYLQLFFSVSFTSSYRPTFEHVSALVEQILISLETQTNEALLAIALPALQKLNSQLVAIANQKKVFSTLVDKLLSRLLSVRRRIDDLKIKEQITDIICKGLFHSDIILEYTSVLSSVDTTAKQTTYVIRLFDLLESMVKQDRNQMLDAVDIMPTLLSAFVISFRQKRNMRSEMMQSNDKKVEIGMFMYMLKIYSNMEQDEPSVYLKSLSQLLEKVVHEGLYTAQIEQDNLLLELSSKMIGYIHSSTGNDQSSIFDILDHLLQIDMSLLESQLNVIWPIMLNPDDQAESSCTRFATSVLKVYTASRQMDVFLNELLEHICRLQLSDLNMLKKPLFKSDFLDLFSRSTSNNYMPIEQILGIFNHFSQKLNQQTQSPNVNFISIYFCRFISSLKPSTQQRQRFQEPSLELFKTFIKPSLTRMNTFIPAIQAHSVLTRVFCENYTQKLESADLASIKSSITSTFEQSKEGNNSEACMRTALCCNALLQHIYYHTLLFKSSSQRLDLVLDFIFDESDAWYIHATWDGSILNIHSKVQAKLACWKLLTDDWFEPLSRCLDKDQAKTFMHIIYQTMKHEHSTRAITASMLSKKMLRCASFYEANCFSSWNVQTYLKAITSLFNTTNQPDTASTAAAKLLSNIDTTAPFTWDKSVIHDLFPHLHVSSTTEPMEIDDMDQQLVTIFNLLALFPNECFGKNERALVIYIATLVDIWCVSNLTLLRSKISLACKRMILQFINYFSVNSILGSNADILSWLITSSLNSTCSALRRASHQLEENVLRRMMAFATAKSVDAQVIEYIKIISDKCKSSVDDYILHGTPIETVSLLNAMTSFMSTRKTTEELVFMNDTKDAIMVISDKVHKALSKARSVIIDILHNATPMDKQLESIKRTFYLVRLLNDYNEILGKDANRVNSAKHLSQDMTSIVSPFIQLLQATVDKDLSILDMATDFIAAFCSMPSHYQHAKMTKHTLATFWFIFSLIYKTENTACIHVLSDTFKSWIKRLPKEQLDIVLNGFLEQAEVEAASRENPQRIGHHLVFLELFSLLTSSENLKTNVKKQVPLFIIKILLLAEKTSSMKFLQLMLKLFVQLTADQSYRFSSFELSLVLSCMIQLAEPSAPERFKGQMDKGIVYSLFQDLCSILSNVMRHYKEQMIDIMPPFIALTQSLLHCFASRHIQLVMNKKSNDKRTNRTFALFVDYAPFDDTAAQRYARVLTTIPQKQNIRTSKSSQSIMKAISKHTPYILLEYFTIQSNPTVCVIQPSTKTILTNALYDILDLCTDSDRAFIMACLGASGKLLFKDFCASWKENHKYSGQ